MARRLFIAGNWKMNLGPQDADSLAGELKRSLAGQTAVDVAVIPPYISLLPVVDRLKYSGIEVGAQDLHTETSGAFTSAISGEMIKQAGCAYVVVGHSERRSVFGDDDTTVNRKVHAAFRSGLLPILCIGETLPQRESGRAEEVVLNQLAQGMAGIHADQIPSITLAYEPVWAIGTGKVAGVEEISDMHGAIRSWLAGRGLRDVPVLYGGSVKPDNADAIFAVADVDGALVGGASLKAADFDAICAAGARVVAARG